MRLVDIVRWQNIPLLECGTSDVPLSVALYYKVNSKADTTYNMATPLPLSRIHKLTLREVACRQ